MNNFDNIICCNNANKEYRYAKKNKKAGNCFLITGETNNFSGKRHKILMPNCSVTVQNNNALNIISNNKNFQKMLNTAAEPKTKGKSLSFASLLAPTDLTLLRLKLKEMKNYGGMVSCSIRAPKNNNNANGYWFIVGYFKQNDNAYELWIADITKINREYNHNHLLYNRLKNFIEIMPNGVLCFRYTPQTQLTYINKNTEKMLGYTSSFDLLENNFSFVQLIHPKDRSAYNQFLIDLKDDGKIYQTELRLQHHQGHYIWVKAIHHLYTDINNKQYCEVVISDISELIATQQDVKEANRSLERIGNLIPGALGEFSFDGSSLGLQQVNDQFYLLAGTRPDDDSYLETHCEEEMFCLKDELPSLIEQINTQLECSTFIKAEFHIEKKNYSLANIRMLASAVYNPQLYSYTLHCLFFDVTAEYEAQEKIAFLQKQLDELKKQKTTINLHQFSF